MKKFISVNAKYYKSRDIKKLLNHYNRTTSPNYKLNDEDIEYDNVNFVFGSEKKLQSKFLKLQKQKDQIRKFKTTNKENELVDMVVSLSEAQAKKYLASGSDFKEAYKHFMDNIKDEYGFEPIGFNLHCDEGYKDNKGNVHYNIHAHCTFYNFDFDNNKSVLRNLRKKDWENMQDIASKSFQDCGLSFERGVKSETPKKHLERIEYITQQKSSELESVIFELENNKVELKELYQTINTQKNNLKALRLDYDKNSTMYKLLTSNVKELQQKEKATRTQYKELDKLIKDKQDELKKVDELISDDEKWIDETKQDLKKFLLSHTTKSTSGKYQINNMKNFYDEIVDLSMYLSNFDIRLEENEKLKTTNQVLRAKIDKVVDTIKMTNEKVDKLSKELIEAKFDRDNLYDKVDRLEDELRTYKDFVDDNSLENDFKRHINKAKQNNEISFNTF